MCFYSICISFDIILKMFFFIFLNNLKNMIVFCINNGYVWNLLCCMESVNDCMILLVCWLIFLWGRKDVIGKFYRY